MDKRRFLGNFILVLLLLFSAILVIVPAEAPDSYAAELKTLTESLKLTEPQIAEAGKILTMIHSQAQKDWEQHADNPEALIQAARLRQQLTDDRLEAILTPEQHAEYRKLKIQRDRDWEYFYLQEGLQLSEQQGVAIRAIVDEYRKKWGAVMPENGTRMGGAGRGMRGGGMNSGMGGSREEPCRAWAQLREGGLPAPGTTA